MFNQSSGLIAVLIATTAWTPAFGQSATEATLDEYFGMVESLGATVTVADKSSTSDVTIWRDIVVSYDDGGMDGSVKWMLPSVEARVRGGGIGLELAERSVMELSGLDTPSETFSVELVLKGQDILINNDGENSETSYAIAETQITTTEDGPLDFDMKMLGSAGIYTFVDGEVPNVAGSTTVDSVLMSYVISNPDAETDLMNSETAISDMRLAFAYDHFDAETAQEFLTGARNAKISYSYGQTDATMRYEVDQQAGSMITSTASAEGEVSAQDGRLSISGKATDMSYDMSAPMMPPMAFSADIANVSMSGQMGEIGEITPADLLMDFGGVTFADNIWAIFDPTGKLPRDPMDLKLDLGALLKWKIASPEQFDDDTPPVDVTRVDLRDLTLKAVGAQILGNGGMDVKMQGMNPVPSGTIALDIKGAMTLLNTLTEMGLVKPEQAMMARMFSQSMARPGPDGDDHLITEVEATEDGAVLVNGTRMR